MKDIPVGIIGGTGGMGKWFADFFRAQGCTVHISGRGEDAGIPALAGRVRVIVIAVPIHVTLETIRKVGPCMAEENLLMDLTSLKAEPVKAMLEWSRSEVIGVHPLFGPGTVSLKGENVVVCPARGETWLPWLRNILLEGGAQLVETTPERHDEMMACVQVLTHLGTIIMGLSLKETGIGDQDLLSFSTPAFRAQMGMVQKIFQGNPRLYADILTGNRATEEIAEIFRRNLSKIMDFIRRHDAEGLTKFMKGYE